MSPRHPHYDLQQALEYTGGSAELLRDAAEVFLQEIPKLLDVIGQARIDGDLSSLSRAAHTLKGSSALFAAPAATEAARQIEERGRAGDLSAIDEAWPKLQHELRTLGQDLAEFIAATDPKVSDEQP